MDTEQTKIRWKELESQIALLDLDIEKEKQRAYTFLTADMIEEYLHNVLYGDFQDVRIRKLLVNTFIENVVLSQESIIITYRFSVIYTKYKIGESNVFETKRQSVKKTAPYIYIPVRIFSLPLRQKKPLF